MRILFVPLTAVACLAQSVESAVYFNPGNDTHRLAAAAAINDLRRGLPRAVEKILPAFDPVPQIEEPAVGPKRVGTHRALDNSFLDAGRWDVLPDGREIWRAGIRSPGAQAMRVHFRDFNAGDGAVWIHDGETSAGPYTARGIFGDGDFWTEIAAGEALTIEYLPARGSGRAIPFTAAEITHLWLDSTKAGPDEPAVAPCHLDIACQPDWLNAARSVARLTFEKSDLTLLCSGSLLATTDNSMVPYFLTAQHCMDDDATARTVVAYWGYQAPICNGTPPSTRGLKTSVGARYIAGSTYEGGDSTLLRLNSVPDGVLFAGWNVEDPPVGAQVAGIHHPGGDYKRFSVGTRDSDDLTRAVPKQNFFAVRWAQGRTERGSSGSPLFNDRRQVVGTLSHGPKAPPGGTVCDAEPYDYYGRFSVHFRAIRRFLEGSGGGATVNPANQIGGALTSGQTANWSIPAANNPILYNGNSAYRIVVPAQSGRLEIRVSTGTPNVDIDLYVRFGESPAVPQGGNLITADFRSEGQSGEEIVIVTPASNPALREGTYFAALVNRATGRAVSGTIVATVTAAGASSNTLTSGAPRSFRYGAVRNPTLFAGELGYRVVVPQGATSLDVRLATSTPDVDVDLYVRFGEDVTVAGGRVVTDHRSEGDTGDERITINSATSPPLRPGTYFIGLVVATPSRDVTGNISATIGSPAVANPTGPATLQSGRPQAFSLRAVQQPTLFSGNNSMRIEVPPGTGQLEIRLRSADPAVDVDLYVRKDADVDIADGGLLADYSATRDSGNEDLIITLRSQPPLTPGTYWISLVLYTTGRPAAGTVTATLTQAIGTELVAGEPVRFSLSAVDRPTLVTSATYRLEVPGRATRAGFRIVTDTPGVNVDLVVRKDRPAAIVDGQVVFDYASTSDTGEETIIFDAESTPPLSPGTYYATLVLFTTGRSAEGAIVGDYVAGESSAAPVDLKRSVRVAKQ